MLRDLYDGRRRHSVNMNTLIRITTDNDATFLMKNHKCSDSFKANDGILGN